MMLIIVFLIMLFFISCIPVTNINYNIDFFFSIGNLVFLLLLIFLTNNMYTFIFILELNSSLVFYKFVVSKFWFVKKNKQNLTKFTRILPTNYINMLFFQY